MYDVHSTDVGVCCSFGLEGAIVVLINKKGVSNDLCNSDGRFAKRRKGFDSINFDSVTQTESKRLFRRLVTLSHVNDRRALLKAYYR